MIYLIGGASRAGKGILGRRLAKHLGCSYFPLDTIFIALHKGFPKASVKGNDADDHKAQKLWKFHKAMIEYLIYEDAMDYVLDGVTILPSQIIKLIKKYPRKIRAVFLGYDTISVADKVKAIRTNHGKFPNDWLEDKKDVYVASHIKTNITRSKRYQKECRQTGLPYYDTSADFKGQHDKAFQFMIGKTHHA